MHELGIVLHVMKEVERVAAENNVEKVASVKLEFGEVSGIVPELLKSAWDWAVKRDRPVLEGAEFVWDIIPAVTYCEHCGKTYETVKYGKTCPYCGSPETYLLQGNEMTIKEIVVYDSEEE